MPSAGKTAQAVDSTRRLEDSLHASIMTIVPCLCKTIAAASSAEVSKQLNALSARPKMCRFTGNSPIAGRVAGNPGGLRWERTICSR
jgi:hypothetical protein